MLLMRTFTCTALAAMTAGPMSCKHFAHAFVPPVEIRAQDESGLEERRDLHGQLQETADQRSQGQPDQRTRAESWIEPPSQSDAADDGAEIEEARGHRGHAENVLRVQHSHGQRGQRDQEDEGIHDAREHDGERRFFRIESRGQKSDEVGRDHDADQDDGAHENRRQRGDFIRELPGRVVAFRGDLLGKDGDESGGERAFREEIAQHVGRAKRGQERVHVAAGAKERGDDDLPDQAENPAAQNGDADNAGRARADALSRDHGCGHRRQQNSGVRSYEREIL